MPSFLRKLQQLFSTGHRGSLRSKFRRSPNRRRLEVLEDRSLLATIVWDGAADGGGSSVDANWMTAANWVGDVVPAAGDNLIFPTGISTNLT
ncbi:MAG: hypothetical protein ACK58L_15570, partial [Planctomycetota bacterium]